MGALRRRGCLLECWESPGRLAATVSSAVVPPCPSAVFNVSTSFCVHLKLGTLEASRKGLGAAENGNEKVLTLSTRAGRENRSMQTRFYRKLELDETIGEAKCPGEDLSVLYF